MGDVIDFKSGKRAKEPAQRTAEFEYERKPDGVGFTLVTGDDSVVRFKVTVAGDHVADAIDMALESLGARYGIDPYTREGMGQLRESVGQVAIDAYVATFVQQHFFETVLMRSGVMPFLGPDLSSDDELVAGEDYVFRAEVLERPQCELESYAPVEVAITPARQVSEDDVESYLDNMAYELGQRAQDGSIEPIEIDDAWVALNFPEAGTLEALRQRIAAMLQRELDEANHREMADRCADELAKRLVDEPDERYLEMMCDSVEDDRIAYLQQQGMSFADYARQPGFDRQLWQEDIRREAREALRRGAALDALADELDLELESADVERVIHRMFPGSEMAAYQSLVNSGQMHHVVEVALREKANEWLIQTAIRPRFGAMRRVK